jgi:hypothetical protein
MFPYRLRPTFILDEEPLVDVDCVPAKLGLYEDCGVPNNTDAY